MKKSLQLYFIPFFVFIQVNAQFTGDSSQNITIQNERNNVHEYALIDDTNQVKVDVKNTEITFNFISEDTQGSISGLELDISFNPKDLESSYFKGTALIETIDTDNFLRDGHLMWKKFFNKKEFPKMKFESIMISKSGKNTFDITGDLTIKGIKKEVVISLSQNYTSLIGKCVIYTSDFDVNIDDQREKNKLEIEFNFPIVVEQQNLNLDGFFK